MSRTCKTCKYYDPANMLARCILCRPEMKDWEPKDRNQAELCESCRHEEKSAYREPCLSCGIAWPGSNSHWEPKEEKMVENCHSCKHEDERSYEFPCKDCKWEPKEDDMENENTTTKIDTDAKMKELEEKVEEQERLIRELERMNTQKDGEIRGLKFAIRCNGVSGGEV